MCMGLPATSQITFIFNVLFPHPPLENGCVPGKPSASVFVASPRQDISQYCTKVFGHH